MLNFRDIELKKKNRREKNNSKSLKCSHCCFNPDIYLTPNKSFFYLYFMVVHIISGTFLFILMDMGYLGKSIMGIFAC